MKKMSERVQFNYRLPGGDSLEVTALVSPGPQARLNYPGDPVEALEIDIDCFLTDGKIGGVPFDPDGLWLHHRGPTFKLLLDVLRDHAADIYQEMVR